MDLVYLNGSLVPKEEAKVPIEDRGYQFADGIYEVMFVWGGRYAFLDRHLARLERSAQALDLAIPGGTAEIRRQAEDLLARDGQETGALYLQITRGVAPREHAFPEKVTPTVVMYLKSASNPGAFLREGVSAVTLPDERWLRCDVKSVSLLPNILARQRAVAAGAKEGILVRDGVVTECTSANLFGVFGGTLRTHPASKRILSGITRGVILEEAHRLGIPIREEPILAQELFTADELFYSGTTSHVQPIARVDGREVPKAPGEVTLQLQSAYFRRLEEVSGKAVVLSP